ncbi:MAG: TolC family protein [Chitinophagales bacterium]|nr:TolC family protein [Chitinophagales bacterium]
MKLHVGLLPCIVMLFLGMPQLLSSQALIDSNRVLTLEEYFTWIKVHHPIARRANLLERQSKALELQAKGGFDPKAYAEWDQKSFDQKDYFSIGEGGLKLPTRFGIELKAAYTVTDGIYLNPERNLPDAGQAIAGITLPVGRGLMIDQRRADLQQAELMASMNEIERQYLLNDLLLAAATAYWEWGMAHQQLEIYKNALTVAEDRLQGIRESFNQGDKPAIDTLETLIQVQNRQLNYSQAKLNWENAALLLSNFLWYEGHLPLEVSSQMRPPALEDIAYGLDTANDIVFQQELVFTHPDIRRYKVKQEQLMIDQRLAKEQLKPRLDLSYNFLGDGINFINEGHSDDGRFNTLLTQNYKWGLSFDMPLLLRKERGKLDLVEIKMQENNLSIEQKLVEISNKISTYYNQLKFLLEQIDIYSSTVDNYQALLDAENLKFRQGESSIFLINAREQKLIEAQLKLTSLRAKFQKNQQSLQWATGQLGR